MWKLYSVGSIAFTAIERVIDKAAATESPTISYTIATLVRAFVFLVFTVIIGLTRIEGVLTFVFYWQILLFALFSLANSLIYTYLTRSCEVTLLGTVACLTPLAYLSVDIVALHTRLNFTQLLGVIMLSFGGLGMSVDVNNFRFRSKISPTTSVLILATMFYQGVELYAFKYLNTSYSVNGVSYFASAWLIVCLGLLLIVTFQGKLSQLELRETRSFAGQTSASKASDVVATLLWLKAITLASVAEVSAMVNGIELIVFLAVTFVAQRLTRARTDEQLGQSGIGWKIGMSILIGIGSWMVSW